MSIFYQVETLTGIITFGGVLVAIWQLRENARLSGQAHAQNAWLKYLELGFSYPEYASTQTVQKRFKIKDIRDLYASELVEVERYWWYLEILLEACESLVKFCPEKSWEKTIKYNLVLHKEAIRIHFTPEVAECFSDGLRTLVNEVLS